MVVVVGKKSDNMESNILSHDKNVIQHSFNSTDAQQTVFLTPRGLRFNASTSVNELLCDQRLRKMSGA